MKIISGAQTGADQAGLDYASDLGMETGGYVTKGRRTMTGPLPDWYMEKMSLVEMSSASYQVRTWKNVEMSDGTIRLAVDFTSPGEKCTMAAIREYNKAYIDVDLLEPIDPSVVRKWLEDNDIKVLNVAGNCQWKEKMDIYHMVYQYLIDVFDA